MNGYLTTVIITAIASIVITAMLVQKLVTLIMRQIKLYHSIMLVELKTRKIMYWVFAAVIGVLIFYVIMQMADPDAPSVADFKRLFGVGRLYTKI